MGRGARELGLRAARDLGDLREMRLDCALQLVQRDAELLEHRDGAALGLRQQGAQQVRRLDLAVAPRRGQRLGLGQSLLALDGELVVTHGAKARHGRHADKLRAALRGLHIARAAV